MVTVLDKEVLRRSLIELAKKEPEYVQALFLEISEDVKKARKQKLNEIIDEDFIEYDAVFKALS